METRTRRRRRVSKSEIVMRSKTTVERLFGQHRGVALRMVLSFPFVLLGVANLLCFLFTRVCIRTICWIGMEKNVRQLRRQLDRATSIEEYEAIARMLDIASGCDKWKKELWSSCYDWQRVEMWTRALRGHRAAGRVHKVCNVLATAQTLKFGGVFTEEVFSYCHWGTKEQIEEFYQELKDSLQFLLRHCRTPTFRDTPCLEVCRFVHHFAATWGHTALYLSGGGMIGFHHFGVGKALLKQGLVPDYLVGCSAGSAVAAWLATRSGSDLERELEGDVFARVFAPFEQSSIWNKISNLFFMGHLCTKDTWLQCARRIYADLSFKEAFELTNRVLNISVCRADVSSGDSNYLLNYKTAPDVVLTSAILASSAFPLLAAPFTLNEKRANGDICPSARFLALPFRDGSLAADVPLHQINREFGIGFSIVAQVNPHVYPFLGLQSRARAGRPARQCIVQYGASVLAILGKMEEFFREVMASILRIGTSLDVWPSIRGMSPSRFLNQTYHGDVTMLPRRIFWSHRLAAANITRDKDVSWYLNEGMLMAFEKSPLIRARLEIERLVMSLDNLCCESLPGMRRGSLHIGGGDHQPHHHYKEDDIPCCDFLETSESATKENDNATPQSWRPTLNRPHPASCEPLLRRHHCHRAESSRSSWQRMNNSSEDGRPSLSPRTLYLTEGASLGGGGEELCREETTTTGDRWFRDRVSQFS